MTKMKISQLFVLISAVLINGQTETETTWSYTTPSSACSDAGQVQFVQIFEVGPTLVVVWQEPDGYEECAFEYRVEYSSRLSTQEAYTEDLHYTFDYSSLPCDLGQVSITPIYESVEIEGSLHTESYGSEIGAVTDIKLYDEDEGLSCYWSNPPNSDLCDFVYLVEYEDESGYTEQVETLSNEVFFKTEVPSCMNINITITPISDQKKGTSQTQSYEATVGVVTNFKLDSVSGEVFAKFDPPLNAEHCNLTYEVSQVEKDCFTKSVGVWAISNSGKEGLVQSGDIETEISMVGDLDVQLSNGVVSMSWSRPANTVGCYIKYAVQFDGSEVTETDNTSIELNTDMEPCHIAVASVWPISSSGMMGAEARTNYERGIGAVLNLTLERDEEQLVATWDIPEDWFSCVLSFLVEYNDGTGTHITVSEETSFSFNYDSCNSADITVTPHTASGLEGVSSYATYKSDCRQ